MCLDIFYMLGCCFFKQSKWTCTIQENFFWSLARLFGGIAISINDDATEESGSFVGNTTDGQLGKKGWNK